LDEGHSVLENKVQTRIIGPKRSGEQEDGKHDILWSLIMDTLSGHLISSLSLKHEYWDR
jgi:hypothetical protein